jgi:hypothetical protein
MRKRLNSVVIALLLVTLSSGCGEADTAQSSLNMEPVASGSIEVPAVETPVVETPAIDTPVIGTTPIEVPAVEESSAETPEYIDLTVMSSTMVYSQVYNMVFYPENYIGTKVKMQGIYSDYLDENTGKHYFACFIKDATACCAQGIEFEPTSEFAYPDDYPSEGDIVTVEGDFDIYTENGEQYCTLRNASLLN